MTTLLSEVKLTPVPPSKPLTVVPDKLGSAPNAPPTVSDLRLPDRSGPAIATMLLSEVKVIPVAPLMPLTAVPDNIVCAPVVVPTASGWIFRIFHKCYRGVLAAQYCVI